jgi:Lrp/AsnC family transcriptional regulator
MTLTEADRRLLREIQRDATASLKDLAERLAMSQSTVWRRIQEFEAAGLIAGRVTLLDPARLGLGVCVFVHANLRDHSTESRDGFERFIAGQSEVLECFSVTGPHDYVLIIRTRDVAAYEDFLMHRLLAHPKVASAQSDFALRQLKYTTSLPI